MLTYVFRRLLLMIPTLIGVTAVVFFIMAYAPGGFSSALNEAGGQDMGVEARRIKQEMINRYALDQPKVIQYGRWLNQVSPVGFKMSDQIQWDTKQTEDLQKVLGTRGWLTTDRQIKQIQGLILDIAAYSQQTPLEVLRRFDLAALDPAKNGPALFELIEAEPINGDEFWQQVQAQMQTDASQEHEQEQATKAKQTPDLIQSTPAFEMVLRELGFGAINKSRVLIGQFKVGIDFGTSRTNRPVTSAITEALPITLLLNLISLPLAYFVSILVGLLAAKYRGSWFDVGSGALMLALYSVPAIWAGTLLISYLANVAHLKWFPASGIHALNADSMPFFPRLADAESGAGFQRGWLLDTAWHLVLPVTCMTYGSFAFLTKVMRGAVLDTISADFVRTAQAKGVAETVVLFRHVLRNSLLPLITIAASILPSLFVGSFVVEYIFSINGMGLLAIDAAKNKDVNLVMATTLVGAVLSMVSLLIRDVLYAVADPRVSYT